MIHKLATFLLIVTFSTQVLANRSPMEYSKLVQNAPMEWLIAHSLSLIEQDHDHGEHEFVEEIFSTIEYDKNNDELILQSNEKTFLLRDKLIAFISNKNVEKSVDEKYSSWLKESTPDRTVSLENKKFNLSGYYFFNHIHTDISQDNQSLKALKISPKKTYEIIDSFLAKRKAKGAVAFCDHDTDLAFEKVKNLKSSQITPLRSIEWGGATHMSLVDIKKDWELLSKGREFKGEESIIQSRSSEGFRIINHPNRKTPFKYTSWLDVNGIEVWNTIMENLPYAKVPLKRSNNRDALKQWSDALKMGKKYTAVGGSDFHFIIPCLRDRSLFYPANFIPIDSNSEITQTKRQLLKGNVSFLTRPTAPKLNIRASLEGKSYKTMGATIIGNGNLHVELQADFSDTENRLKSFCYNTVSRFYRILSFWKKRQWEIRFYNLAGEIIAKKEINPKSFGSDKSFVASFNYEVSGEDLVRAELWQINKKTERIDLLGATNPIYFNR